MRFIQKLKKNSGRSGINTSGAPRISSPHDLSVNVSGATSDLRLSEITVFDRFRRERSLAILTFRVVSHLFFYIYQLQVHVTYYYVPPSYSKGLPGQLSWPSLVLEGCQW